MMRLVPMLALETGLSADDLHQIIRTAPRRYKSYEIPKRSGGTREIAQPAREVKLLQRVLIEQILSKLPVHGSAMAYRPGLSIRDNAALHAGGGPILKMDFKDFFPSIRGQDWIEYCDRHDILAEDDRKLSALILFRKKKREHLLRLSIGAPSSPALSNILMYQFDAFVSDAARQREINYTRYADDLTFSGQRIGMLKDMVDIVRQTTKKLLHPKLTVNEQKTTFATAKNRRTVTGITLSNDGNLSLGHDRKRLLSAQIHHALNGKLGSEELRKLIGFLAFAKVIEPSFLERMRAKYGPDNILKLQKMARSNL